MGPVDLVWAAAILAGAAYLLYRSFARSERKGHCCGCGGGGACQRSAKGRAP